VSAPTDPAAAGERIEQLLDASAAFGPAARERAEDLVRVVADLYGAGLERLLDCLHEAGALSDPVVARLAEDDLISSLLLVHGLHPFGVQERLTRALQRLGPEAGSVTVRSLTGDRVVLHVSGSGQGCGSNLAEVEVAVRGAVEAAVPELVVELRSGEPTLISLGDVTSRLRVGQR
jgi:hypothetical protein